jgi:hypothetical protein
MLLWESWRRSNLRTKIVETTALRLGKAQPIPQLERFSIDAVVARADLPQPESDLAKLFFDKKGKTVDKWLSYIRAYDRHLSPYRNTDFALLEIGVFRGGPWNSSVSTSARRRLCSASTSTQRAPASLKRRIMCGSVRRPIRFSYAPLCRKWAGWTSSSMMDRTSRRTKRPASKRSTRCCPPAACTSSKTFTPRIGGINGTAVTNGQEPQLRWSRI